MQIQTSVFEIDNLQYWSQDFFDSLFLTVLQKTLYLDHTPNKSNKKTSLYLGRRIVSVMKTAKELQQPAISLKQLHCTNDGCKVDTRPS